MHKVHKDRKSDMLSRHQNWYIKTNLCLIHSKFSTAIEAMITVCFSSLLLELMPCHAAVFIGGGVYYYFYSKMQCLFKGGFTLDLLFFILAAVSNFYFICWNNCEIVLIVFLVYCLHLVICFFFSVYLLMNGILKLMIFISVNVLYL